MIQSYTAEPPIPAPAPPIASNEVKLERLVHDITGAILHAKHMDGHLECARVEAILMAKLRTMAESLAARGRSLHTVQSYLVKMETQNLGYYQQITDLIAKVEQLQEEIRRMKARAMLGHPEPEEAAR